MDVGISTSQVFHC